MRTLFSPTARANGRRSSSLLAGSMTSIGFLPRVSGRTTSVLKTSASGSPSVAATPSAERIVSENSCVSYGILRWSSARIAFVFCIVTSFGEMIHGPEIAVPIHMAAYTGTIWKARVDGKGCDMATTTVPTRTERDSLGEVAVPADALYGAQTARAVGNFPISGIRPHRTFIESTAMVKWAAA